MKWLTDSWYRIHPVRLVLLPLSMLYVLVITFRKLAYRFNLLKKHRLPVPVIVVGNLTVGGTGKTPVVIWLAKQLQQAGYTPGIISRGYGGHADHYPQLVSPDSDPKTVGDEPVIISRQTGCPVAVAPKRIDAARLLQQQYKCSIIISDDGLQHYALERDIEIVVVDGMRYFGNRYCLPAGPLREPITRLRHIDFAILNGGPRDAQYKMLLDAGLATNLLDPTVHKPLADFKGQVVHSIAGIGHPERFFSYLNTQGLAIEPHYFADHYQYNFEDINFADNQPIIMTEKDAVKCQAFATSNMWYIPVEAVISGDLTQQLLSKLAGKTSNG